MMRITIRTPEGTQVAHFTSLAALIWMYLHIDNPDLEASYLDKFEIVIEEKLDEAPDICTMGDMLEEAREDISL